jgi:hypothetical protein
MGTDSSTCMLCGPSAIFERQRWLQCCRRKVICRCPHRLEVVHPRIRGCIRGGIRGSTTKSFADAPIVVDPRIPTTRLGRGAASTNVQYRHTNTVYVLYICGSLTVVNTFGWTRPWPVVHRAGHGPGCLCPRMNYHEYTALVGFRQCRLQTDPW